MSRFFSIYPMFQVVKRSLSTDFTHLEKVSRYRQPESLVFSGGGVRGFALLGVYEALVKSGIFKNVKSMIGTSVGGLFSAPIAAGMSYQHLMDVTRNQNFKDMLGQRTSYFGFERDGDPMLQFERDIISESILKYLHENPIKLEQGDIENHLRLKKIEVDALDPSKSISFENLAFLRKIDPDAFKDLTLIAVNKDTGEVTYFNAETTPDVDIADAGRASASIPGLLEAMTIKGVKYVDGGVFKNIPSDAETEVLSRSQVIKVCEQKEYELRQKRLIFVFNEPYANDPIHKALHTNEQQLYRPGWFDSFMLNHIIRWAGGIQSNKRCTVEAESDYKNIQENYPLQTIQLKTGVSSTNFKSGAEKKEVLILEGFYSTYEYLVNHDLVKSDQHYEFSNFTFHLIKNYLKYKPWSSYLGYSSYDLAKSKLLLDFLQELKSNETEEVNILELAQKLIDKCLYDTYSLEYGLTTRSLLVLVDTLNGVFVNPDVKFAFMHTLGIKDDLNIVDYQFIKEDFEDYVKTKKEQLLENTEEDVNKDKEELFELSPGTLFYESDEYSLDTGEDYEDSDEEPFQW